MFLLKYNRNFIFFCGATKRGKGKNTKRGRVTSSRFVKSFEDQVELSGSVHTTICGLAVAAVVACNVSQNLSGVVMLQPSFRLLSVVIPCLPRILLQFMLLLPELDFVSIFKGFLLLVQKRFDLTGYPRLVREVITSAALSISLLVLFACFPSRISQSVHSKQSLRVSLADGDQLLEWWLAATSQEVCNMAVETPGCDLTCQEVVEARTCKGL